MSIPELHNLNIEDMKKIFPQNYYTKYASHLKILEFEKIAIEQQKKRKTINFKPRRKQTEEKLEAPTRQVRINHYDNFEDTIQKNKEELKRLNFFTNILNQKLKSSPSPKKDIIRSPTKMSKELDDKTLLRLKAIDDMQYEQEMQKKDKIKKKREKDLVCKFVKKAKSLTSFQKKKENAEDVINRRQKNQSMMLSERTRGKSHSLIGSINKKTQSLKKLGFVTNRNLNNGSKVSKKEEPKDLVSETKRIREQLDSMKLIKRYDQLMKTREQKAYLQ